MAMSGLKGDGFATVISLRLSTEEGADIDGSRAAAEAAGLNYIHVPFDPTEVDSSVLEEFMVAVGDQSNHPVFFHCGTGTRAAALWMVMRVSKDDLNIEAASVEARQIAAKPDMAVALAEKILRP